MFKKLSKVFCEIKWQCVYRKKGQEEKRFNPKSLNKWHQIKTDPRYWCADPFIVEDEGKYYVFCEMMDLKTSHGLLGVTELNIDKDTYIKPVQDFNCHVSYPNVFKWEGSYYMIPETSARKTIELYKTTNFPNKWKKIAVLADNLHAVDTTVFNLQDKLYLFIYEPNGANNSLSIAKLDMKNFCLVNRKKVKQYTSRIGRPAGDIIFSQGHMYRPTQYGVNTYGGKIIFKEFSYNPVSYEYKENDISEISPSMLKNISKIPTPLGCHTYNSVGNIEIIDIKYKSFSLFRPIRILFKKLELGGYRYYEGK